MDLEGLAGAFGVDPSGARQWVDGAASWLREQAEHLDVDLGHSGAAASEPFAAEPFDDNEPFEEEPSTTVTPVDPLSGAGPSGAGPHPLDLPSEDQGLALAALDSGRWAVESGSDRLVTTTGGRNPSDTLGLVGELRARDWITADGAVTLVGRDALRRWIESAVKR